MENELNLMYSDSNIEKIDITSIDKLDNGYIRIIGNNESISVITNGKFTLKINSQTKVKKIFNYKDNDYVIVQNMFGEFTLIHLNDGDKIIKRVKEINYIGDGLLEVGENNRYCSEKVFDLNTNNYIPFPNNMIFREYKDGILVLKKKDNKENTEMAIDRFGTIILPETSGGIRVIDKNKFIYDKSLIDFEQKTTIENTDLIMPLKDEKVMILKNRKIFILNKELDVVKTYQIGMTKKPWCTFVINEECIMMIFKKKVKTKKHEPRIEKDETIIIDIKNDTINKADFIPRFSSDEVFIIKGEDNKLGLMNKEGKIILNTEYNEIEALNDKDDKYFFIQNDKGSYIFNSKTKSLKEVTYTKMNPFRDGLAFCYTKEPKGYQLIDEELNAVFNLDHMGHSMFYYKNGILCYHSGSYFNGYDAYTIITKEGIVLMQSRKCMVNKNEFDLLEIKDYETGKNVLFNMNTGNFEQIQLSVPIDDSKTLDFSKYHIAELFSKNEDNLLEENKGVIKRLIKPKDEE